jgi:hypothetical protein
MATFRATKSLFGAAIANAKKKADEAKQKVMSFVATPLQVKWIEAVLSGEYNFLGIGGGIRGTKTFACISALIILSRIFPRSRWAIVRKDLPTIRRNVIPSMDKLRVMSGGFVGELNMSTWSYSCANGSVLILFAEQFIQDPELERWKGLEVNGFDLEEGSELSEKSFNKAIERAGSWIIPPSLEDPTPNQPPPLVLVNFNPCANWPRKIFYMPWKMGTIAKPFFFLPATIADNPYATDAYKESLKHLPPEEYKRFVEGEWDFVDDPNQLIKSEWVWNARNVDPVGDEHRLGCDVARYGDDWTSIARTKGNALVKMIAIKHFDVIQVATSLLNEAGRRDAPVTGPNCRIDVVGLGAGTVDYCRKKGLPVTDLTAGAKPIERPGVFFKYKNLRSQMWWEFREKLRLGTFSFNLRDAKGNVIPIPEKLVGDLASVRYEISGDKVIEVESKDDIKLRLGRSTDDGDAVVMAAFDVPPRPKKPVLPPTVVYTGH